MTGPPPRDRLRAGLLLALLVTLPLEPAWVFATSHDAEKDLLRQTALHLFDPVLAAILVVELAAWWRSGRRWPPTVLGRLTVAFAVLGVAAWLAHPSSHGVEVLVRGAGAVAVASLVRRLRGRDLDVVLALVFAFGVAEALLALAQQWNGGIITGGPFEMARFPLFEFRRTVAGQGSFSHPYHLVITLSVALGAGFVGLSRAGPRARWWWASGFLLIGAAFGFGFSRTNVAAVLGALAVAAVGRDTRRLSGPRLAGLLLVVGFVAAGYAGLDGWRYKEAVTVDAAHFDSSRSELAEVARGVIADHPLLGVGPGRYVQHDVDQHLTDRHLPPHDFVIQAAAEEGVLAGLVAGGLVVCLVLRALRGGRWSVVALGLVVPYVLFDAFPYDYAQGFVVSGLWLGVVLTAADRSGSQRRQEDLLAGRGVGEGDGPQGRELLGEQGG